YHQRHHEDPRHLLALGVAFLLPAHPQAALRPPFPHHPSHPRTHQRRLPTHALPVLPAASTASKTARPPARSRASPSAPPSSPRRAPRVLHPTAPTRLQTPAFPPRPLPATKTPPPPPTTTTSTTNASLGPHPSTPPHPPSRPPRFLTPPARTALASASCTTPTTAARSSCPSPRSGRRSCSSRPSRRCRVRCRVHGDARCRGWRC
ncbi:hypothetical protein LTR39_005060, partial [Cryomyces antarcticus]